MNSNSNNVVKLWDVHKAYILGQNVVPALRGINLEIQAGDFVAIMGPSGCGKTTLLNLIGTLDTPSRGIITICDKDISALKDNQKADMRKDELGFVFQFYNLIPTMSARDNIMLPMTFKGIPKKERKEKSLELLDSVGLKQRSEHFPSEMSGGEQQRIALCRALANDPSLILLDEPTGDLDSSSATEIMQLLKKINNELKKTFIMVTHDNNNLSYAKKCIRMKDGKIIDNANK